MPTSRVLEVPALSLVVLIGVSEELRSDFVRRHFAPEEVQTTLSGAARRLGNGMLAVLNAPHLQATDREAAPRLAREHDVQAVGIVLDPESSDPAFSDPAGHRLAGLLRAGLGGPDLPGLQAEGFRTVYRLHSRAELEGAELRRVPLNPDRRELQGPFDLIGDVHGCLPELLSLLERLGCAVNGEVVTPVPGRTLVFLGDLTDRGPDSPGVLRLVMGMVQAGTALCVQGNHDAKLLRALQGHAVQLTHGLEVTLDQFRSQPPEFAETVKAFLAGLPSHLLLVGGRLVAAHAGLPASLQGRDSRRVWAFSLYGDVDRSGPPARDGLPVRRDWAASYFGAALVVYGHTPVQQPRWRNRTVNLDTGCVFGGQLSALRYPELKTVSVPARAIYREAGRAPILVPLEERQPEALESEG